MSYPAKHFPGTPWRVRRWVRKAVESLGESKAKWTVPLEAIARYESDCNPNVPDRDSLRGMMQQSVGQYAAAREDFGRVIGRIDYRDPVQAVQVAILYINGELYGYGGYGGISGLLERDDRGPASVLRAWTQRPRATYSELRPWYNGY